MKNRVVLGSSGLEVSPVCFGTGQLSPRFWGEQPKGEIVAAMRAAFAAGINFYDTSDAYGDGYAESVLGEFLRQAPRGEVIVATKVFNHYNPDASRYPDLSPAHIVERCEASLRRLGVERIDLYLLHFYDPMTPLAEVAETMKRLQAQGKIGRYGVSNHTVEQVRAQRRFGDYTVVQPPYSLLQPDGESDLLPYCQAEALGVMIYSPMHKGLLTGKYKGTETFSDFRAHHPDFQGERFRTIAEAVQGLRPMAEGYGCTLYQLLLAATLMHPAIQVAVVGIKTQDQIAEAAGAMGRSIARPDYFKIRTVLSLGAAPKIRDAGGKVK